MTKAWSMSHMIYCENSASNQINIQIFFSLKEGNNNYGKGQKGLQSVRDSEYASPHAVKQAICHLKMKASHSNHVIKQSNEDHVHSNHVTKEVKMMINNNKKNVKCK